MLSRKRSFSEAIFLIFFFWPSVISGASGCRPFWAALLLISSSIRRDLHCSGVSVGRRLNRALFSLARRYLNCDTVSSGRFLAIRARFSLARRALNSSTVSSGCFLAFILFLKVSAASAGRGGVTRPTFFLPSTALRFTAGREASSSNISMS